MRRAKAKVIVVLNGAMGATGGNYFLPKVEEPFFLGVLKYFARAEIWADVVVPESQPAWWKVPSGNTVGTFTVRSLAGASLPKIVRHAIRLCRIMLGILRVKQSEPHAVLYIFYPGVVAIFTAWLARLFKIQYALYVRGQFDEKGIKSKCHRANIAGAVGCIVTGETLLGRVIKVNKAAEVVAPMMNVGMSDLRVSPAETLQTGRSRLLYVGQLTAAKGVETVIEVMKQLMSEGLDVEVTMVGTGTKAAVKWVQGMIEDSKLADRINLIVGADPVTVREQFLAADVFLFPTVYSEGFPRVVYEALTLGVPVVTTDLDLFRWLLIDGKNAVLCEPRVDAYAAGVKDIISSTNLKQQLRIAGLQSMRELFTRWPDYGHAGQVHRMLNLPNTGTSVGRVSDKG